MRMHQSALLSLALTASLLSAGARAEPLAEAGDIDIVKVLNDMEIIAERDIDSNLPFMIKLIRVRADGECNGEPQTCPTEDVYIAVSGFDEYPDRRLYRLPAAYGWQFKEWVELPRKDTPDQYYVFALERQVPAAEASAGWWSTELYRVRVNYHDAALERISP